MDSQNIKVYLAISGALIILFILVLVIPFTKKTTPSPLQPTASPPFPTSIQTDSTDSTDSISIPADFTGVAEEELPPEVLDTSLQKKDLRQKVPLNLTAFLIDFDYSEDKFIVTLNEPKDQAKKEFEEWLKNNYPNLNINQFNFK